MKPESSFVRLLQEIIQECDPSPAEEYHLLYEMLEFINNPKQVKAKWTILKKMSRMMFCSCVLSTGNRKGEMCGKPIKSGTTFCTLHQNQEDLSSSEEEEEFNHKYNFPIYKRNPIDTYIQEEKPKRKTKKETKKETEKETDSDVLPIQPGQKVISDNDIVIYPNKFKNFVYPNTNLILDKDLRVVAKEGKEGLWLPLTKEDITEAKRNRLRYKILDLTFKGETGPNKSKITTKQDE